MMSNSCDWASGDVLSLVSADTTVSDRNFAVILESKGKGAWLLANPSSPYQRLSIAQNNKLCYRDSNDKNSFFQAIFHETDPSLVAFKSAFKTIYICCDAANSLSLSNELSYLRFKIVRDYYQRLQVSSAICFDDSSIATCDIARNELDLEHLLHFYHFGYLHIPRVIEPYKLFHCLKCLNHYLGIPGAIISGGIQGGVLGKYEGKITRMPEVTNLFEGALSDIIQHYFFGQFGSIDKTGSNLQIQIAFRFPELTTIGECFTDDLSSFPWHTDGLRQGRLHSFSLLVGVCLSDVQQDLAGNLLVWPKSHKLLHKCLINEHGALDTFRLQHLLDSGFNCQKREIWEEIIEEFHNHCSTHATEIKDSPSRPIVSELNGSFAVNTHDNEPNLPSLGKPMSLLMKAGDIVILHADTAHAGGPNMSCDIRKMVYFRVKFKSNDSEINDWSTIEMHHKEHMWYDTPELIRRIRELCSVRDSK